MKKKWQDIIHYMTVLKATDFKIKMIGDENIEELVTMSRILEIYC